MKALEATPSNLQKTLAVLLVCCQLFLAAGVLGKTVHAHATHVSHTSRTLHTGSKAKHKTKMAAHHKVARSVEPQMPAGYQEKSGLLLKSYQLHQLAWSDIAQKNYTAAAASLHQAITIASQCYGENSKLLLPLYLDLAEVEQKTGQVNQAAATLATCLKLNPAFTDASIKLALIKLQQGNIDEALTAGKQALKFAPQDPRVHILMSLLLAKAGETGQSAQEKNEARKLYKCMPQIKPQTSNESKPSGAPATAQQESQQLPDHESDHENDEPDSELELP